MKTKKNYREISSEEYKSSSQENWGKDPCGAEYADPEYEKYSKEYFDDLERTRYSIQHWQLSEFESFDIEGKEVLEIGFGQGTDHLMMARSGGIMHGIDLTEESKTITENRFSLYGYKSRLLTGDAEELPYKENTFDFVYSFGVLHHTPHIAKAIGEIHRVLKPGGKCYIAVYNKNSLFFWWSVFFADYICRMKFLKMTLSQRISLIEYPNTNPNLYVKLHKRKELIEMFRDFENVVASTNHLSRTDLSLNALFSDRFINRNSTRFGWYIIIRADKGNA